MDKQIKDHINQYLELKREHDLLISIDGIGDKTAALILAELPDVANFNNSGQVVAYAGLSPQEHTSGSSVHKQTRLTKTGNQRLKTTMFFPALTALKHNQIIINLPQRLEKQVKLRWLL